MIKAIDPVAIEFFVRAWRLEPSGLPFATHSSVLLPAVLDGRPVMLKLTEEPDEQRGAALLAWWNGHGSARVIEEAPGAVLMERLTGSRSLYELAIEGEDDRAVETLIEVAHQLHSYEATSPPPSLTSLEELFAPLLASHADDEIVRSGRTIANDLLATRTSSIPLHGDLHHRNVLDAGDGRWLAIDPKGILGEPAYDFANLFRNPIPALATDPARFDERARVIARSTGIDVRRIAGWAAAFCALSIVWDYYPEGGAETDRATARIALDFLR